MTDLRIDPFTIAPRHILASSVNGSPLIRPTEAKPARLAAGKVL
jgi:hypothetical protein